MPSLTVNICVFTLVLLSIQQLCDARPQSKREITKDYFHPLPAEHFEKSSDGKYYLKKSAHRSDSEVNYATAEKKGVSLNDLKSSALDIPKEKTEKTEKENLKAVETEKVDLEIATPKPIPHVLEEAKEVKDHISPKSDIVSDEAVKKTEINKEKASFTPVDPKFVVPPKPDSKDEIEVKTNLPPASPEEEKVDEKVAIGQIPHLYPRLIPVPNTFRIPGVPVLIPIHKITYGSVSVVPLPPAAVSDRLPLPPMHDVSDRLPMPLEDDIVGEGGPESAEMEEAAERAAERKVEEEGYPINPLRLLSFGGILKDLKEATLTEGGKETKEVDVLGKKYLMQSNVMKYPSRENGHTFVRFLSVKPLEKADEGVRTVDEADKSIVAETLEVKAKEADEFSSKKDEVLKNEEIVEKAKESEIEKEQVAEMAKEPEILKAEETQIRYKIESQVPRELSVKETVGVKLQTEGEDLIEEQTEKSIDVLKDEKMVEMKRSFVEQEIKTKKGEEGMTSEEVTGTVLKIEPGTEEGEMIYSIKTEESEDKKQKLKGDEGILPEEEGSKEMIRIAEAAVEKIIGQDMIESSKKEYFLPEKKKKDLIKGEEKLKSKKNIKEKKSKKKCTCEEEEYSDTDYSSMDSEDDY